MSLAHYWDALNRLETNTPIRVQKFTKINNDTVALEAGMKRGSIKKSRKNYAKLIEAINIAKMKQSDPQIQVRQKIRQKTEQVKSYKHKYHESLNREVMHIRKIRNLLSAEKFNELYKS